MRNLIIASFLVFFAYQVQGQEIDNSKKIEEGSIVQINQPQVYGFKHIHFPRANFIIKKGGIANYNSVKGNLVEITSIRTKEDGTRQVQLKRIDGQKFFRNFTTVGADFDKALESGEILLYENAS